MKTLIAAVAALILTACGGGSETDAEFCARWRAENATGGGSIRLGGLLVAQQEPLECKGL